jgi:hypothetical protein
MRRAREGPRRRDHDGGGTLGRTMGCPLSNHNQGTGWKAREGLEGPRK